MKEFSTQLQNLIDKLIKVDNLSDRIQSLYNQTNENLEKIKSVESAIDKIVKEKTLGFPWLADAISQYFEFRDLKIAEFLQNKLRPAISSAERVKELAREKREFHKKFIITRNLIKYYEALFPWLSDFVGEDIDELLVQTFQQTATDDEEIDPVRSYLTQGEYEKLTVTERNQKALDRFWTKKKSPWQIGKDYERYIGYLYEQKDYSVYYQGIEKGLEDLGRDLICKKNNSIEIVQCKYWREEKAIHEKHINQLFGTTVEYFIKHVSNQTVPQLDFFPTMLKNKQITAALITSASLSETARDFANILGINVIDHFPFKKYPSIKCNVSYRDGSKIYHLPFDQQYDRTTIEKERNECYVSTVAEAEKLGFRRAWRWHGDKE
ncbi:MAG: restriction endonuclease [Melioribacteraceae bacterium]